MNGEQTFAEVAVLRMFQASGWEARWLEAYNAEPGWPIVLDAGLSPEDFLIVEWEFCGGSGTR